MAATKIVPMNPLDHRVPWFGKNVGVRYGQSSGIAAPRQRLGQSDQTFCLCTSECVRSRARTGCGQHRWRSRRRQRYSLCRCFPRKPACTRWSIRQENRSIAVDSSRNIAQSDWVPFPTKSAAGLPERRLFSFPVAHGKICAWNSIPCDSRNQTSGNEALHHPVDAWHFHPDARINSVVRDGRLWRACPVAPAMRGQLVRYHTKCRRLAKLCQ